MSVYGCNQSRNIEAIFSILSASSQQWLGPIPEPPVFQIADMWWQACLACHGASWGHKQACWAKQHCEQSMMTELPYGPGSPLVSLVTFFGGFIGGVTLDSSRTQNSPAWPFLVASPTIAMFDEVVRRRSTSNWFTPVRRSPQVYSTYKWTQGGYNCGY